MIGMIRLIFYIEVIELQSLPHTFVTHQDLLLP